MIEIKDADAYQKLASRTLIAEPDAEYTPEELASAWRILQLAGSAGLVSEHGKKGIFHRHGLDIARLAHELDDVAYTVLDLKRGPLPAPGFAPSPHDILLIWNALGLAGEAGEVARLIEQGIKTGRSPDREQMIKELGDVLWYVAAIATKLEIDLGYVMLANITKLMQRYPEGYSSEASQQRVDTVQEA